jgi:hypothetical protein
MLAGYEDAEETENPSLLRLKRALVNEQIAPEILNYESVVVSELRLRVEQQERVVEEESEGGPGGDGDLFKAGLLQMEIDRVRFLIRSYLRVRLAKVRCEWRAPPLRSAACVHGATTVAAFAHHHSSLPPVPRAGNCLAPLSLSRRAD